VSGLSGFFANGLVCGFRQDLLIGFPEVRKRLTILILNRDFGPQSATGFLASITDHKGYDLASAPTHNSPEPTFVDFLEYKAPGFIKFQDITQLCW